MVILAWVGLRIVYLGIILFLLVNKKSLQIKQTRFTMRDEMK